MKKILCFFSIIFVFLSSFSVTSCTLFQYRKKAIESEISDAVNVSSLVLRSFLMQKENDYSAFDLLNGTKGLSADQMLNPKKNQFNGEILGNLEENIFGGNDSHNNEQGKGSDFFSKNMENNKFINPSLGSKKIPGSSSTLNTINTIQLALTSVFPFNSESVQLVTGLILKYLDLYHLVNNQGKPGNYIKDIFRFVEDNEGKKEKNPFLGYITNIFAPINEDICYKNAISAALYNIFAFIYSCEKEHDDDNLFKIQIDKDYSNVNKEINNIKKDNKEYEKKYLYKDITNISLEMLLKHLKETSRAIQSIFVLINYFFQYFNTNNKLNIKNISIENNVTDFTHLFSSSSGLENWELKETILNKGYKNGISKDAIYQGLDSLINHNNNGQSFSKILAILFNSNPKKEKRPINLPINNLIFNFIGSIPFYHQDSITLKIEYILSLFPSIWNIFPDLSSNYTLDSFFESFDSKKLDSLIKLLNGLLKIDISKKDLNEFLETIFKDKDLIKSPYDKENEEGIYQLDHYESMPGSRASGSMYTLFSNSEEGILGKILNSQLLRDFIELPNWLKKVTTLKELLINLGNEIILFNFISIADIIDVINSGNKSLKSSPIDEFKSKNIYDNFSKLDSAECLKKTKSLYDKYVDWDKNTFSNQRSKPTDLDSVLYYPLVAFANPVIVDNDISKANEILGFKNGDEIENSILFYLNKITSTKTFDAVVNSFIFSLLNELRENILHNNNSFLSNVTDYLLWEIDSIKSSSFSTKLPDYISYVLYYKGNDKFEYRPFKYKIILKLDSNKIYYKIYDVKQL